MFGTQAVSKMTVGQGLAKRTELKLFDNHMTVELLGPLFDFSPPMWKLSTLFRNEIFKAMAKSVMEGLIFTYVWDFDQQEDWDFVDQTCDVFESRGATVYFVELKADLDKRLKRNKSPHCLENKPSKRNIARSDNELKETIDNYRLNSYDGEIKKENYILIDNTNMDATAVAEMIADRFKL